MCFQKMNPPAASRYRTGEADRITARAASAHEQAIADEKLRSRCSLPTSAQRLGELWTKAALLSAARMLCFPSALHRFPCDVEARTYLHDGVLRKVKQLPLLAVLPYLHRCIAESSCSYPAIFIARVSLSCDNLPQPFL